MSGFIKTQYGHTDFFFGIIDGGFATSRKETQGLHGSPANVSVGIGG